MRMIVGAISAVMLAGSAHATTLFADNFDAEGTPGTSTLNYSSFANWVVEGQVDLVQTPEYGINCAVKCVDLDGTAGPGRLNSKSIAFLGGRAIKLTFDVGGSQRSGATDNFLFTVDFGQLTDINGFASLGGFDPGQINPGNYTGLSTLGTYDELVPGTRGFLTYGLTWIPVASGTLTLSFWTPSRDNVGPLLDNVLVSQVPEPAAWLLLVAGFGLVGVSARRRRPGMVAA